MSEKMSEPYFENMLVRFRADSSYVNIFYNMINTFSPYILCDHFIGDEAWKWRILSLLPPGKNDLNSTGSIESIKEYDIVQCQLEFFGHFAENILPKIDKKIVLITSQFEFIGFERTEQTDFVKNHPNILLWITTNPIYPPSDTYMPFPCGISQFNLLPYAKVLLQSTETTNKTREIGHGWLSPTNQCRAVLPPGPKYSEEEFYNMIHSSQFMISPIGDRDDCYRHYESIGLQTIPISNVSDYYRPIFKDNMWYCSIEDMKEILETNTAPAGYKPPNRDLISFEYYKHQVRGRISRLIAGLS